MPWFPFSWLQCWPFAYCVAVVVDHYSRKAIAPGVFKNWPSASDIIDWLDVIIQSIGHSPKYIITDQGPQFREEYRDWCARRAAIRTEAKTQKICETIEQSPLAHRRTQTRSLSKAMFDGTALPVRAVSVESSNLLSNCQRTRAMPRRNCASGRIINHFSGFLTLCIIAQRAKVKLYLWCVDSPERHESNASQRWVDRLILTSN